MEKEQKEEAGIYSKTKVYATATAPHHKDGELVECSQNLADKMIANGWATADKANKAAKGKEAATS